MKKLHLLVCLVLLVPLCYAQHSNPTQLKDCQGQIGNDKLYPSETCSVILTYLSPLDQIGSILENGSFLVLSPAADGKTSAKTYYLPPKLRSEIALNTIKATLDDIEGDVFIARVLEREPNGLIVAMAPQGRDLWLNLRDVYCYYHPAETYVDLSDTKQTCLQITHLPDEKTLKGQFDGAFIFKMNYLTFLNASAAMRIDSANRASKQGQQTSTVATPAVSQAKQTPTGETSGRCEKSISFADAEGGQVVPRVPSFAQKWITKNQNKYPGLCFSQAPIRNAENYLLVFSTSESAFNGIYPTVRTSASTGTTPVSGSGTATDNYGGMWNYTYNGTVTTTTTTTEHLNLPYTDTSNTLYLYSYDQRGTLMSRHTRTSTTRQGGETYNTLGYNLGARLGAIHIRERLLNEAVKDVAGDRR